MAEGRTFRVVARGRISLVAACAAVLVWSTNAFAAGTALEDLTVVQVLALQFGGATVALGLTRVLTSSSRRDGRHPRADWRTAAVSVIGVAGTIALQYLAFATAPIVAANAIAYAWPLLVAGWATVRHNGSGSSASVALSVLGLVGVAMLFTQRGSGATAGAAPLVGYAAAVGSAVAMAWYTLSAPRLAGRRTDMLLFATATATAATAPWAIAHGAPWSPAGAVLAAIYAGLGPMATGYALWTMAMASPGAARLAPIAYATPLLSTAVLLISGERLDPIGLAGCGLILVCVAGVLVDRSRRQETAPQTTDISDRESPRNDAPERRRPRPDHSPP